MKKSLDNARDELKRVDHLIYVSLKYTRTTDVLMSVVSRIISFYDSLLEAILINAQDQKIIDDYPKSPGLRCELIKKIKHDDSDISEIVDLYLILRKISRSEYSISEQYKRHVTARFELDSRIVDISIDTVTDYYKDCKKNFEYLEEFLTS